MMSDFTIMLNIMAQEIDTLNPGRSFIESNVFIKNYALANAVYLHLTPLIDSFLQVVAGNMPGSSLGAANFTGETMNFTLRLLKKSSLKLLVHTQQEQAMAIIAPCFLMGLLYHLFYFNYGSRSLVSGVKLDLLAKEWLPKTTVASVILRNYYKKENQGSAQLLFDHYFNHTLEPNLKQLGLGFWMRGKAHFFLLNLFLAGALLGVEFDLQTEK